MAMVLARVVCARLGGANTHDLIAVPKFEISIEAAPKAMQTKINERAVPAARDGNELDLRVLSA